MDVFLRSLHCRLRHERVRTAATRQRWLTCRRALIHRAPAAVPKPGLSVYLRSDLEMAMAYGCQSEGPAGLGARKAALK